MILRHQFFSATATGILRGRTLPHCGCPCIVCWFTGSIYGPTGSHYHSPGLHSWLPSHPRHVSSLRMGKGFHVTEYSKYLLSIATFHPPMEAKDSREPSFFFPLCNIVINKLSRSSILFTGGIPKDIKGCVITLRPTRLHRAYLFLYPRRPRLLLKVNVLAPHEESVWLYGVNPSFAATSSFTNVSRGVSTIMA